MLGISEGTATITATVKGYPNISASCQIEVVPGIDYPVFDLAEDLADQDKWVTDGSPVFEKWTGDAGNHEDPGQHCEV